MTTNIFHWLSEYWHANAEKFPVYFCCVRLGRSLAQDKFYQLRNPHMNYCNNSSLHTAESQAADKIQSRFKPSKRPVNVHFFSLTILLAKSALLVEIADLFSMQSVVQIWQSCSSNGALISLSWSWKKFSISILVAPWDTWPQRPFISSLSLLNSW